MNNTSEKRLFQIVSAQQGYFTSKQAIEAGYKINNHPYHVKRGHWIREWRGIYRLASFPYQPDDQYVLWSLWSCNRHGQPQGVYSFETALTIYDVSDVMPEKLHMTVPRKFRRSREAPPILILHRDDLLEANCQTMRGFKVTTPLKTMIDIAEASIEDHLIKQAAREFKNRGLLTKKDILEVIEKKPSLARYFIENIQK